MSAGVQRMMLVGIVVASVGSVIGFWGTHQQLRVRYQASVVTQQHLQTQTKELRQEYQRVADAFGGAQQRIGELTQTLAARDSELERTVARLMQEERAIQELEGKLVSAQRQVGLLQGELAAHLEQQPVGGAQAEGVAPVQLDRVIVTQSSSTGLGLEGRIVSVHPDWKFVVIDLGWDLVKVGDVVSIYRNSQLLGKARVERVQEQVCAATILSDWKISDVQVNDAVRIL